MSNIIVYLLIFLFLTNKLFAVDIPIIVISPGKTPQSYDKVGSSVLVIDSDEIENSSNFFIADICFTIY